MKWALAICTVVAAALLAISVQRDTTVAQAAETSDSCQGLLDNPPEVLFETVQIYKFLRRLDDFDCPAIEEGDFDALVNRIELNLVSYSLLEERLVPQAPALRDLLISNYVADYEAAQTTLDTNALLPVIDAAYYPCDGNATCVGERLSKALGSSNLVAPEAACLFGLAGTCPAVSTDMPLVNTASIEGADDPEAMKAARHAFICTRYQRCPTETE